MISLVENNTDITTSEVASNILSAIVDAWASWVVLGVLEISNSHCVVSEESGWHIFATVNSDEVDVSIKANVNTQPRLCFFCSKGNGRSGRSLKDAT